MSQVLQVIALVDVRFPRCMGRLKSTSIPRFQTSARIGHREPTVTHRFQLVGKRVSRAGPRDLEDLVAETVTAEGCIDDVRVVGLDAALAQKIAGDIGKIGPRIARGHVRNSFIARVELEPLNGVLGQQQHRVVV